MLRLCTIALLCLITKGGIAQQLRWEIPIDDPALPLTLTGNGEFVGINTGVYLHSTRLYSGHSFGTLLSPIWDDQKFEFNFDRTVEGARDRDIFFTLRQTYAAPNTQQKLVTISKYTSRAPTPDWEYTFPDTVYSKQDSDLAVSADGERIVALVRDQSTGRFRLSLFTPYTAQPIQQILVNSLYSIVTFSVSENGKLAVLTDNSKMVVIDLDTHTQQTISIAGLPNFGALAVSEDGNLIAYGTAGKVRVWSRQPDGTFSFLKDLPLSNADYVSRLALDVNGENLAIGIQRYGEPHYARVVKYNLPSETQILSYIISDDTPQASFQNGFSELQLSSDGQVLAVGTWGTGDPNVPELYVFHGAEQVPALTHDVTGSILTLDLNRDGTKLVVGAKDEHATVPGADGRYLFFDTTEEDMALYGAPQQGATVTVKMSFVAAQTAHLLIASSLASEPRTIPGIGTLFLSKDEMEMLAESALCLPDGSAEISFTLPEGAAIVGTTLYMQGVGQRPRELTDDTVQMTILP